MVWLLAAILAMQAQDEVRVSSRPYAPVLRVDTRLVEIAAVVRDGHGKTVSGLTKDDFRVLDDRKERLIDHFVVENTLTEALNDHKSAPSDEGVKTGLPATSDRPLRFLVLFIDDVNGKDEALAADLPRTQTAAEKFVKDAVKAGVRVGVFTASGQPKLDFTTDQGKLIEAIREILTEDTVAEWPVGISVQPAKDGISVIVSVDISKLRFSKRGDRQVQKIAFTTALFDAQGKMAAAKEGTMDLSLTEETFKRLAASGVNAKVTLEVPAGKYKLRQVAEDGLDGKIACSSHAIEVR